MNKRTGPDRGFSKKVQRKSLSYQEKKYLELRKKYLRGHDKSKPLTAQEKEEYLKKFRNYKEQKR